MFVFEVEKVSETVLQMHLELLFVLEQLVEVDPELVGVGRIEGVLGRGSTGVVYRATQLAVNRAVALKILRPELVGTLESKLS